MSGLSGIARVQFSRQANKEVSMKNVINLTPHGIRIAMSDESYVDFDASGQVARVSSKEVSGDELHAVTIGNARYEHTAIPTVKMEYGTVEGLPEPIEGTVYIVSGMVLAQVPHRKDVYAPNTGGTAIRENGQVFAVRSLVSN